jgi:Cu/Ag efflux protein CusF
MKKLFTIMIAVLTVVAFAGSVMAQAPAKPAEPAKAAAPAEKPKAEKKEVPKALKFAGSVAGYEAGKMIKVKGKDKEMAFDLTGDTKMKGAVKEGARVTVMYKKDGDKLVATSIAAVAEKKAAEKKPAAPEKK